MKNHQDNISTLPALLRTPASVDTLETSSICCAAAGIIAPSSSTAEAFIPHEKLRGAALADAALNAQECPLAQLVLGGKPLETWKDSAQKTLFYVFCLLKVLVQQFALIPILIVKRYPVVELSGDPLPVRCRHLQNAYNLEIVGTKLHHGKCIKPVNMGRPSQVPSLLKVAVNTFSTKVFIGLGHNTVQTLKHIHLPNCCHQKQFFDATLLLLLLQRFMPDRKRTCCDDGYDRSEGLHPAGKVTTQYPPIFEASNNQPKTAAQNQKAPDTPDAVSHHKWRNSRYPYFHLHYHPVKKEELAECPSSRGLPA